MKRLLLQLAIYPLRLYWFLFRPHGYGVKCIVRRSDGKVLLVRNAYGNGAWTLPGGGIHAHEDASGAARRELIEEVGIDIGDLREIGAFTSTADYKQDHVTVYYGESDEEVSGRRVSEIAASGWFAPDALPEETGAIARRAMQMVK